MTSYLVGRALRRYFKPPWCMPTETGKETDIVCKFATPVNDDIRMILLLSLLLLLLLLLLLSLIRND